jgi:hypothetical protein
MEAAAAGPTSPVLADPGTSRMKDRLRNRRADLMAAAGCATIGVFLAALPPAIAWLRTGDPMWFADYDEFGLYFPMAGSAMAKGSFFLSDPVSVGASPTSYPTIQFAVGILPARWLGVGPQYIGLFWRLFAGATIGASLFWLVSRLRRVVNRDGFSARAESPGPSGPLTTALLTVFLMVDLGIMSCNLIIRPGVIAAEALRVYARSGWMPLYSGQWRLVTPGLSWVYLFFFAGTLVQIGHDPRPGDRWRRRLVGGLALGLLFHAYFYFWTAAVLALGLALIVDPETDRRREYFHQAWIGLLIGLPALIRNAWIKLEVAGGTAVTQDDWLHRIDKFQKIGHFSEILVPKTAILLALLTGIWVWRRQRALRPVWLLAMSGLLLLNNQIVTGLQTQNDHYGYVFAPLLSVLAALAALDLLGTRVRGRWLRGLALVVLALELTIAFGVRFLEATQCRESRNFRRAYDAYRTEVQPAGAPLALEPGSVVGGVLSFVNLATSLSLARPLSGAMVNLSPLVRDREWSARVAANGVLRGLSRPEFAREQKTVVALLEWGKWARDAGLRADLLQERLTDFDRFAADPRAIVRELDVRYVALDAGTPAPAYLTSASSAAGDVRDPVWHRIRSGPTWQVWALPSRDSANSTP